MPSFSRIFALASMAAVASASSIPANLKRAISPDCTNPHVVASTSIPVGGRVVEFTTLSCAGQAKRGVELGKRTLYDQLTCASTDSCAITTTPPPESVCGADCHVTCSSDAGRLPPISEDCDVIRNAIAIFSPYISDSFQVASYTVETLSAGTCAYFFQNTSPTDLTYCWSGFSTTGAAAGKGCFPPVQPIQSQGLCSATDGRWAVGAAHS